jgi:hypothetical protein
MQQRLQLAAELVHDPEVRGSDAEEPDIIPRRS